MDRCNYSKENISKICVAYNNIYRKLLGYSRRDSAMYVNNRINDLYARFRHSCYGFIRRLKQSTNSLECQHDCKHLLVKM